MGSITKRMSASGPRYRAEVRIKQGGAIVHREAKTFRTKGMARTWIEKRENTLYSRADFTRYTIKQAIDEYVELYEKIQNWQRTKRTTLEFLRKRIGDWDATEITTGRLVNYITDRRKGGTGPATVNNDLIWLQVVFKAMRALDRPVALQAVEDAIVVCKQQGLTARAKSRRRRPTPDELERLDDFFKNRQTSIPMSDIMWFAIHSSRRQAEITRLEWGDNDPDTLTGMVRDLKHPRQKTGNHRRFKYTEAAYSIIERQPKLYNVIFPYNAKTIGAYFTRAVMSIGIHDLRFHDLRHEATSRLFEQGYSIIEVQQFTLHEDWKVLSRYTNLRPENVTLR
jgi:integrase